MCWCNGESVDHLLIHFGGAYQLWTFVFRSFGVAWVLPRRELDLLIGLRNWLGSTLQIALYIVTLFDWSQAWGCTSSNSLPMFIESFLSCTLLWVFFVLFLLLCALLAWPCLFSIIFFSYKKEKDLKIAF